MKRVLVLLICCVMVFSLAACGGGGTSGSGAAGGEVLMGVLIYKFDDTYISTVRQALEKYAEEVGQAKGVKINLDMQDGKGDQATQNDQLDVLLQKNPDVVLVNAVDAGSSQGLADKIVAAEVPFIFFNREPAKTVMQPEVDGEDEADWPVVGLFVGTTASEAGVMQGDLLADLWEENPDLDLNGDGECQYLVFKGEPGNPEAEARTQYSVSQAEERGMKMNDVYGQPVVANWATDEAQSEMESILGAHQDEIEAVFCNNDDMALGVIAALNSVGYNTGGPDDGDWIPVIGVDATDAGMTAISEGKMYGTVKQDGDAMGKALIEIALNAAQSADIPWLEGTDYQLAEDGVSVRIPYSPISETA